VRVSPQPFHTEKILALFRQRLDNSLSGSEAGQQMGRLMPDEPCDGYWHARPGIEQVVIPNQAGFGRPLSTTI
jgi:O2-independent ubiquinone biosynthesis protein UbiV